MGKVTALFSYPVKSCAAVPLTSTSCRISGFPHDREYVIADPSAQKIYTQRDLPELALLKPSFDTANRLCLRGFDETEITVVEIAPNRRVLLSVWGNDYFAIDQGDQVSSWLTAQLGIECRLYKRAETVTADPTLKQDNTRYDASFVDCCPISVVFQEELDQLNNRLDEPVELSRFRPSVVINGLAQEEVTSTKRLRSGNLNLEYIRPVGRCVIINIDQERGEKGSANCLKTLAEYRMLNQKAVLGHYFFALKEGTLSVGDLISA